METEKLFVYGIFLGEFNRKNYGMTNPQYSTVPGYVTVGAGIVQAVPVEDNTIALTGLLVDMDSSRWRDLDSLEGGYDRTVVTTNGGVKAYMYQRRGYGKDYRNATEEEVKEAFKGSRNPWGRK